jgi:uncharacterized repeat protein (TIGR03803 family)
MTFAILTLAMLLSLLIGARPAHAQSGPYGVVSPTTLNFGQVVVGQTSIPQLVSLKNTGDSELTVSNISISPTFAITINHCANGVKPGTHCNLSVTFTPQGPGAETGSLAFADNASNSPQTISLYGTGTAAAQETVLYSFTSTPDGSVPNGGVIFDKAGNLYGTTVAGGTDGTDCGGDGCGTVFELSPGTNGVWTETVLHSFDFNGEDGVQPRIGVIFDGAGNLYGTTANGGTNGLGTVFELSPNGSGGWNEKVLHSFNMTDGWQPWNSLLLDADGDLYGGTQWGGPYNSGTVFELTPSTNGTWTEKILHNFGKGHDGVDSRGMIFGTDGSLYGTTAFGGSHNIGIVYQLSPRANGKWTEKILLNFNGKNGYEPSFGNLLFDAAGNLYGTTIEGGPYDQGVVFQLVPQTSGKWKENILFAKNGGGYMIFDKAGNLYGTIYSWGTYGGGSIFKLTPGTDGTWNESVSYSFEGSPDAANPFGNLIFDSLGNLYGTTSCGGSDGTGTGSGCGGLGYGTVYELAP